MRAKKKRVVARKRKPARRRITNEDLFIQQWRNELAAIERENERLRRDRVV